MLRWKVGLVWLVLASALAHAETRIALVIGNGAYGSSPLLNPPNDAKLIGDTLAALGFEVVVRRDADQATMKRALQDFGARLEKGGADAVGLFYYAGHGVQLNGRNYLIPTKANIEREGDVEIEAVSADWVLEQMRYARNRLNIVILDACRNNPFVRSMRSADRGLAKMDAPAGTLIAYSTAPGDVAADGTGRNSPYTLALAQAMREVRQPVEQVFKRARVAVRSATSDQQTPWESSSLTGDFYFASTAPPVPPTAVPLPAPAKSASTAGKDAVVAYSAPTQQSRVAGACGLAVGRWTVPNIPGEVVIKDDQTVVWWKNSGDKLPAVSGTWVCDSAASRRFVLTWGHGSIDTVTLSSDGRTLSGRNQLGLPLGYFRAR
jgi:hypothetical protein